MNKIYRDVTVEGVPDKEIIEVSYTERNQRRIQIIRKQDLNPEDLQEISKIEEDEEGGKSKRMASVILRRIGDLWESMKANQS